MTLKFTLTRRSILRFLLLTLPLLLGPLTYPVARAQNPPAKDKPYVVEYYYKAKWGYADEFIRLFKKNHYPFLKKQIELGNIVSVSADAPVYHSTEDGRWDYRVRIVWKSVSVIGDTAGDEQILKQLFPDQETFKREEQRRFEILLAHWDVPIKSVNLDEK